MQQNIKNCTHYTDRFVSTFLMWRNFSMWQIFSTFKRDNFCVQSEISPHGRIFLHRPVTNMRYAPACYHFHHHCHHHCHNAHQVWVDYSCDGSLLDLGMSPTRWVLIKTFIHNTLSSKSQLSWYQPSLPSFHLSCCPWLVSWAQKRWKWSPLMMMVVTMMMMVVAIVPEIFLKVSVHYLGIPGHTTWYLWPEIW